MELLLDPANWIAFATLTLLEIVLGIDNIIFISILVSRLPRHQQALARQIGLSLAMVMRILLLLSLAWIMRLTEPLFTLLGEVISGRDLILLVGGAFLIFKSTTEIHAALEGAQAEQGSAAEAGFAAIVFQIGLMDIIFSLDSVITAVGLVKHIPIMVAAIVVAVVVMMLAAKSISEFVDRHPTVKMLALSFLMLIGVALVGEGLDMHIPKGYIYFAMAFSMIVEMFNIRASRNRAQPVKLHRALTDDEKHVLSEN